MDAIWEQLCIGYVNDTLSPMQRKQVEQRIAAGDHELLEKLESMTGFPREKIRKAASENQAREEQKNKDNLKTYVTSAPIVSSSPPPTELPRLEKQTTSRISVWITRISAVLALFSILGLMYQQWHIQLAQSTVEAYKQREKDYNAQVNRMRDHIRLLSSQNDRIKATLPSDFAFLLHAGTRDQQHYFKKAYLLLDLSTQRTVGMVRLDSLPSHRQLTFWIQNKYREWNFYGSIESYTSDSLYMNFRGDALTHARVLEIYDAPLGLQEPAYGEGIRVARETMP